MEFSELAQKLNCREPSADLEISLSKLGQPAYELLMSALNRTDLSERQVGNALLLLMKVRFHGDQAAFFQKVLSMFTDRRIHVRSVAIRIAMALCLLGEKEKAFAIPNASRSELMPVLREALKNDLEQPTIDGAKQFLEG